MKINALEVLKRIDKLGMIPERMLFKIRPDERSHFRYFGWLKIGVVVIGKEPSWIHMHWIEQRIKKEFGHCNELMLFLFTLFHEIGHYYASMEGVENNPLSESILNIMYEVASTREQHLDVQKRYRELAAEKFCDDFAVEEIRNLFNKERRMTYSGESQS
jgi:hypothetical protein